MDINTILRHVDHTLLSRTATWADIRTVCDDGMRFGTASVCIPPCFVRQAKQYIAQQGGTLPVCTVIGFPNGYATTRAKLAEAEDALACGADELDVVINVGWAKQRQYDLVFDELAALKRLCGGHILKVIVEACLLTEDEKVAMCDVVSRSGADFIKTSTGFSTGGATVQDVALFAQHIANGVQIKAAGGIRTLQAAQTYLEMGCTRLGTSAIVQLAKEQM